MDDIKFKKEILNQIRRYLKGEITKEEYYDIAEPFYSKYANCCNDEIFKRKFLDTVADACIIYIDEPGLIPEIKEKEFYKELDYVYKELKKLKQKN